MSGVGIVRTLLAGNAGLIAVVPASRIMAGILPPKTAVPAISVTQISAVPDAPIRRGTDPMLWTERVQVTVDAATYPQQKSVLALVRAALPSTRGPVGGFSCDSISLDMEGPDTFGADEGFHVGSQDVVVRYTR